jgi:hypothetical protein
MAPVVPPSFLFRYTFAVPRLAELPKSGPPELPADAVLAAPATINGAVPFAEVRVAWHPKGLALGVVVAGKSGKPACNRQRPETSDGLQVWIDTRDTQTIHRASRYCHHFCLLPAGGGRSAGDPFGCELPIARARETHNLAAPKSIALRADRAKDGYRLDAWLPAELLAGYDPEHSRRLGFYYCVTDADLGEQHLSVGREFPFDSDPSLWSSLDLIG